MEPRTEQLKCFALGHPLSSGMVFPSLTKMDYWTPLSNPPNLNLFGSVKLAPLRGAVADD